MKNLDVNEILFRASATQDIQGLDNELTEKQLLKLKELHEKKFTPPKLTDKQKDEYDDLVAKKKSESLTAPQEKKFAGLHQKATAKYGSLTEKQEEEYQDLLRRKNSPPELSQGVKTYLLKVFSDWYYDRREYIKSKYLKKGKNVEEDSITLLSKFDGKLYFNNKERLESRFFTGEWDVTDEKDLSKAEVVLDVKSSFSLDTFLKAKFSDIVDARYRAQLQTYMNLLQEIAGANVQKAGIAYCLVNSPIDIVNDNIRAIHWNYGIPDDAQIDPETATPHEKEFIKECLMAERNHIFDMGLFMNRYSFYDSQHSQYGLEWKYDIPEADRVKKFMIDYDSEFIKRSKSQAVLCRKYIKEVLLENTASYQELIKQANQ